jgi:neutral ceramidase
MTMAKLRVGAAALDITPHLGCYVSGSFSERRADEVSYPLHTTAVVFDDGDTQVAYVQNDLLFLMLEHFDKAKARAQELTGIPPENMMMSCTHTHYGPSVAPLFMQPVDDDYLDWVAAKIGDVVKLAQNRLQPAVIGHTSGSCPEETHNRRWWMKDGSVRMNPTPGSEDLVRPAGPTDPEVALLVAETPEGAPIAAICNYSLHYVGGGGGNTLSANYFGAFSEALQRIAGAEFVAVIANGCCGDINNVDFTRPRRAEIPYPEYQIDRVAAALAAEAYKVWRQLDGRQQDVTLAAAAELPTYRRRTAAEEEQRVVAGGQTALEQIPETADSRREMYARERAEVDKLPLDIKTEVQALRVGDLAMVGLPGEFFVEYGLAIKRQSPFARTMTIELANDWIGYVPTDRGLDEGGYETWLARSSKVAKGGEELFVSTALRCLERVAD